MQRAAVLIGVERTGGLPHLQAVQRGIDEMRAWAATQPGMAGRVVTLTDADGGSVTVSDVKKAIREFIDLGTLEQLFVYFAGHGVNVRLGQYWLLSGAPDDPQEAVNVNGSIELAKFCGVPHVVLISDACRTAAASVRAQNVEGSVVFPNLGTLPKRGCVDVFYATQVGSPALEVQDAAAVEAGFQAVYTSAVADGLGGARADLVEIDPAAGRAVGRVRPWPFRWYLEAEVPSRLVRLGVPITQSQLPDADLDSHDKMWLAEVTIAAAPVPAPPAAAPPGRTRGRATAPGAGVADGDSVDVAERVAPGLEASSAAPPPSRPAAARPPARQTARTQRGAETLVDVSLGMVRSVLQWSARGASETRSGQQRPGAALFLDVLGRTAPPRAIEFGHFESTCGFRINGIAVVEAVGTAAAGVEPLHPDVVRVWPSGTAPASVLLVFENGQGALLPAIPGFVAGLTYDAGELANVSYEPSDNTQLWADVQAQLPRLRELRAVVAAAARLGSFRLEREEDLRALAEQMQLADTVDPTLGLYTAYALHARARRDDLIELHEHLERGVHARLFDVWLLTRTPTPAKEPVPPDVVPAVPLLSKAWSLLDVYGVRLAPALEGVQSHVVNSLWTLFDAEGVERVRAAIRSGEIR